ncbi:MAG: UDP-N-acetylmuramoyl-L-alanyl-D-glutamate--2,6-diaminopimelate ligase [Paracoccaceae bacterium]
MSEAATLGSLGLAGLAHAGPAPDAEAIVAGLAVDSRKVKDGFVFVAIKGTQLDGAEFIQFALRQGAVAVICTEEGLETAGATVEKIMVPFLLVREPREVLARAAARFYGTQPSNMIAVTGTNGKTSVADFTRQIWAACGCKAAAFGTTGVAGEGFEEPLAMTTPEPIQLHELLARLAAQGCTHAAMEASSHGLAQHRVDGVRFRAACLTNITRDHMDYHTDHDDYVGAKMRLFHNVLPHGGTAVLNVDDPAFDLARMATPARNVMGVGRGEAADLRILGAEYRSDGQDVTFEFQGKRHMARLDLIGGFQADNALLAAGLAIATDVQPQDAFAALEKLTGVRGRMEHVATRANGATVYVDYAHTPDALATALTAIRPHVSGRLIVVGGAGGDRDPGKRPLMGQAMAENADAVVVTDDNPRSEDPTAIRMAVLEGAPEADNIGDRAEAILSGVDMLRNPGDCLLIAGKGHEQGQEIAGVQHPFDDASQARAAVAALDGEETI